MATAAAPASSSGLNPFSNPEAALICAVCLSDFDAGHRRPLILPRCGHTFCRICMKDLAARGDIVCPSCRTKYPSELEVDDLPINFNIQCLASSTSTGAPLPVTRSKSQPQGEDDGSKCVEHRIRLVFWCTSCEVPACGECLYESHPPPAHHICRIHEVVMKIKEKAEVMTSESAKDVVKRMGESLLRSLRDVSDLQEAAHLLHEVTRLGRSAQGANDLPSITSVFESAKSVRQRVASLDYSTLDAGSLSPRSETIIATRPAVLALSENGCLAKVMVEKMGIHIYSLQSASTAYSVAVKLGILTACVKKEAPMTFLDIKAGERKLGRVYITLHGAMRRSQQFMALCLGTLGHTYRGTKFDGISEKGQPGEYIRGGDYNVRGGMGGEAIMDGLEWGGSWSKPKEAGHVCGVGGEADRRFGSLFAICLRDNPDDTFKSPFGKVTQGMDVIEIATRHNPFNAVHVSDCGVVIPMDPERKK
ncbi:hypothetical protein SK128_021129 [Halocaridina rubra]|uniref:Uncharacterized protein n=1 Tax=Halocaridina rubra TaxID=373956 RepID=A0AAN8XIF3_HALRR